MQAITVYKLDENGREVWHYPAVVREFLSNGVCLEAFFNRDDLDLGFATFKRGDRFVEFFFTNRWYNIFAVYDRDGHVLKGWYCNVCRPAQISTRAVRCQDLALDLWVSPAGDTIVLDEDEFAALAIPERDRKKGYDALQQLLTMAKQRQLPQ